MKKVSFLPFFVSNERFSHIRRNNRGKSFTKLEIFLMTNEKSEVYFCTSKKITNFAPAISKSELWLAMELLSFLHSKPAPVAKLVDALDLGSSNASCVGSSPIRRTVKKISC